MATKGCVTIISRCLVVIITTKISRAGRTILVGGTNVTQSTHVTVVARRASQRLRNTSVSCVTRMDTALIEVGARKRSAQPTITATITHTHASAHGGAGHTLGARRNVDGHTTGSEFIALMDGALGVKTRTVSVLGGLTSATQTNFTGSAVMAVVARSVVGH